jgi:hypothetical protein
MISTKRISENIDQMNWDGKWFILFYDGWGPSMIAVIVY